MSPPLHLLSAVQDRYPARQVLIDGVAWSVRDTRRGTGSEVPLLLLPGALGTGDVFYQLLAELGTAHRLISVTYPALAQAQALADGFVRLLDVLDLPVVDLLGTSLGGYVAQVAALAHPKRLRKLVLANTFHDPGLQQARWPPAQEFAQIAIGDILRAARLQLEKGAEPTPEHTELKRVMLALVGQDQSADAVRAMRLAVLTAGPLDRVPLPDEAITLIDDDQDPVIAPATREQMRQRYAGCRHIRIAGGGHFPANLRPAEYQAAVRDILRS